jgi:hypothetical protein
MQPGGKLQPTIERVPDERMAELPRVKASNRSTVNCQAVGRLKDYGLRESGESTTGRTECAMFSSLMLPGRPR